MMPEFMCDAVNLEGLNFTIPEIQTLLDGIRPMVRPMIKIKSPICLSFKPPSALRQRIHMPIASLGVP